VLKILISLLTFLWLHASTDVVTQALTWQGVQRELLMQRLELKKLISQKNKDNKEFFNLQQQLVAIYLAQKRYKLGFGTAFMPTEKAMHSYVHKKTFLDLKTKELLPLYKKLVIDYQKKYTTGEIENIKKNINQQEALNLLHTDLFNQSNPDSTKEFSKIVTITSIENFIKSMPVALINKKNNELLSWITPVAGIRDNDNLQCWQPIDGAVVLCPDNGTVAAIHSFKNAFIIFIKQGHFTYVVNGLNSCCVKVGDILKQGHPLGMCSNNNATVIELQLWRDDVKLDPEPYHKVTLL
jgi:hypothetical protein